jgi:hypothetical protein
MSELKTFPITLISDTLSISLDNLFDSSWKHIQIEKEKVKLNPKQKKGFRPIPKPNATQQKSIKRKIGRLQTKANRAQKISMLYSFIALEHMTYEILNRLRDANDVDLLAEKDKKKAFWGINPNTNTTQIREIRKTIRYLLSRPEMESEDCDCSELKTDPEIESFLANGHKIKNTFVHGISGDKEVELTPSGEKEVIEKDDNTRIEIQEMDSITKNVSLTTFFQAIQQLKNDKIFFCSHATGDPSHICLSMAEAFCRFGYRITRSLAKHFNIGISCSFYYNDTKFVVVTNGEIQEMQKENSDIAINFSTNEIHKLYKANGDEILSTRKQRE